MNFLLVIILPLVMAGGCVVIRDYRRTAASAACATLILDGFYVWQLPVGIPSRILGMTLIAVPAETIILLAQLGLIIVMLLGLIALPEGRQVVPVLLVIAGLMVGSCLVRDFFGATALLIMAGVVACSCMLPVRMGYVVHAIASSMMSYIVALLAGGILLLAGSALGTTASGNSPLVASLMIGGIALWVGLVPYLLFSNQSNGEALAWVLPGIAVVWQLAGLRLLLALLGTEPPLFAEGSAIWPLGLALGAVLALVAPIFVRDTTQRSVVFVTIAHAGQLIFGLSLTATHALPGVVLGVVSQALGVLLLMIGSVILMVAGTKSSFSIRALAGASFIVGLLVLLGVPPLGAWMGQALLLQAASASGILPFAVLLLSLLLLILAMVRLIRHSMFVPVRATESLEQEVLEPTETASLPVAGDTNPRFVTLALQIGICVLLLIALVSGLWPDVLVTHTFMAAGGMP